MTMMTISDIGIEEGDNCLLDFSLSVNCIHVGKMFVKNTTSWVGNPAFFGEFQSKIKFFEHT